MTWNPIDSPVRYILLKGKRSPGIAAFGGLPSSVRMWDKTQGHGYSGAYSVFRGRDLAEFSVRLTLYTREDWANWYAWKPLVDAVPKRRGGGKDSGTLDIWHPLLEALDIKAVCVKEVIAPEEGDTGEWTAEIKFMEFRPPKFTLAKPEGAAATPVDPVEEFIGELTDKVQVERMADEDAP